MCVDPLSPSRPAAAGPATAGGATAQGPATDDRTASDPAASWRGGAAPVQAPPPVAGGRPAGRGTDRTGRSRPGWGHADPVRDRSDGGAGPAGPGARRDDLAPPVVAVVPGLDPGRSPGTSPTPASDPATETPDESSDDERRGSRLRRFGLRRPTD